MLLWHWNPRRFSLSLSLSLWGQHIKTFSTALYFLFILWSEIRSHEQVNETYFHKKNRKQLKSKSQNRCPSNAFIYIIMPCLHWQPIRREREAIWITYSSVRQIGYELTTTSAGSLQKCFYFAEQWSTAAAVYFMMQNVISMCTTVFILFI